MGEDGSPRMRAVACSTVRPRTETSLTSALDKHIAHVNQADLGCFARRRHGGDCVRSCCRQKIQSADFAIIICVNHAKACFVLLRPSPSLSRAEKYRSKLNSSLESFPFLFMSKVSKPALYSSRVIIPSRSLSSASNRKPDACVTCRLHAGSFPQQRVQAHLESQENPKRKTRSDDECTNQTNHPLDMIRGRPKETGSLPVNT